MLIAFPGPGDVWMASSPDWCVSYQMIHLIRFGAESVGLAADYRTARGPKYRGLSFLFHDGIPPMENTGNYLHYSLV